MNKHLRYYLSLGMLFFLTLLWVGFSGGDKSLQFLVIGMASVLYVVLGVSHHIEHHTASLKVVLEYVLFASLGLVVCYLLSI